MPAKNPKTTNKIKKESGSEKAVILHKNLKLKREDKMLEKVERYVDKNREKTSQEIADRKSKRPAKKYQEWELELMISRVGVESMPKDRVKKTSKRILYIIYAIIFIAALIFVIKYFYVWNLPQISQFSRYY